MYRTSRRSPSRPRRAIIAVAVVSALLVALTQPAAPAAASALGAVPMQPAAASTPPPWSSVLAGEPARSAWGFLQDEAVALLASHGVSADSAPQDARPLIRAYIFVELIALIDRQASGDPLTAQQGAALTFLTAQVQQERHASAVDAYAKYVNFATNEQHCVPGTGPVYQDGSPGMGGVACVFSQMFGNQPNAPAFNAVGFSEATQAFESPQAAAVFFDTAHSLSWWSNPAVAAGESAEQASLEEQLADVLKDKLGEAGQEALQEIGTALFEVAGGESGAASWAVAAAALAVITASGIWSYVDATKTASELEDRAATQPADISVDLSGLATGSGAMELLYVVLAQTLPTGDAIPTSASQQLTQNPVGATTVTAIGDYPCSWDSSAEYVIGTTGYTGCFGYTFASDPDFVAARYDGSQTPPAQTASDPQFTLSAEGSSSTTLSPTLQHSGAVLMPWVASDNYGHPLLYDRTSARNVDGVAPTLNVVDTGVESGAYTPQQGYTSYLHDGMVVSEFGPWIPAVSSGDQSTWQYDQGIRYVDWQGNWWIAWYRDGTFFHVKMAEPVGPMTPGTEVDEGGTGPCVENPVTPGYQYSDLYTTYGPDCLFGGNWTRTTSVQPGDALLVDGQVRVVDRQTTCVYMKTDTASQLANAFGIFPHTYCGAPEDSTGYGFASTALHLKPGVSTNWEAWNGWDILAHLLHFPTGSFSLGAKDDYAMRLVQADLANCGTTASSDCYTSPTIDYKASAGGTMQNWSATLTYPPQVSVASLSGQEGRAVTGTVATLTTGDPLAVASQFTVSVNWGDGSLTAGRFSAGTGDSFVFAGSHTYGDEGTYTVTVVATDTKTGLTSTATRKVTIADAPLSAVGTDVAATEGHAVTSVPVATFTDANPGATVADFTQGGGSTMIDWGDGTTSAGTVTRTGTGTFAVAGSHTYADEGDYPIVVSIVDDGGATTATSSSSAHVADAAISVLATGPAVSTNPVNGTLAAITDANPGATVADFTQGGGSTMIDWGDGTTSAGTVTRTGTGTFAVAGSHTYSHLGPYTVKVVVHDDGGSTDTASFGVTVYAFPSGGAFVIGDRDATTGAQVTFWGARWAADNTLSGTATPPATFKGFSATATAPACGGTWTARTGNSTPAPAGPLPSYMGVIVSRTVAQSGSTVTGDVARIVVVKTDKGYGPGAGHDGTGTVSAPVCSS